MNTRQVPQREYAKTIRISEYNRTESNNLFIGGWESFDLDVFCGRKSKTEVEARSPKRIKLSFDKNKEFIEMLNIITETPKK